MAVPRAAAIRSRLSVGRRADDKEEKEKKVKEDKATPPGQAKKESSSSSSDNGSEAPTSGDATATPPAEAAAPTEQPASSDSSGGGGDSLTAPASESQPASDGPAPPADAPATPADSPAVGSDSGSQNKPPSEKLESTSPDGTDSQPGTEAGASSSDPKASSTPSTSVSSSKGLGTTGSQDPLAPSSTSIGGTNRGTDEKLAGSSKTGIAVGVAVAIIALLLLGFFILRRRRSHSSKQPVPRWRKLRDRYFNGEKSASRGSDVPSLKESLLSGAADMESGYGGRRNGPPPVGEVRVPIVNAVQRAIFARHRSGAVLVLRPARPNSPPMTLADSASNFSMEEPAPASSIGISLQPVLSHHQPSQQALPQLPKNMSPSAIEARRTSEGSIHSHCSRRSSQSSRPQSFSPSETFSDPFPYDRDYGPSGPGTPADQSTPQSSTWTGWVGDGGQYADKPRMSQMSGIVG